MQALFRRALNDTFVRYTVASVGALAVDWGTFLLLLETPLFAGAAAAISYCFGIVAHWLLLSRSVFAAQSRPRGMARTRQKAVFFVSTGAGLALTTAIISLADVAGADVRLSKGVAVIASFLLNYFIRKNFVFTAGQAQRPA
jgi:putative flippase GtrA